MEPHVQLKLSLDTTTSSYLKVLSFLTFQNIFVQFTAKCCILQKDGYNRDMTKQICNLWAETNGDYDLLSNRLSGWVIKKSAEFSKLYPQLDLSEIIHVSNIGVWEASKRFDPDKGCKFITYATFWIIREMNKLLEQSNVIAIPRDRLAQVSLVTVSVAKLAEETNSYNLSYEDISADCGLPVETVEALLKAISSNVLSLDTPVNDEPDTPRIGQYILGQSGIEDIDQYRELFKDMLSVLNERERDVIEHIYGIDCVEEDVKTIAARYEATTQLIYLIKNKGIQKIKQYLEEKLNVTTVEDMF